MGTMSAIGTMSARPRILFLCHCLPYPPHSGVTSRTFNVLKQLQQEFDVVLLPFFRRNHQPDAEARQEARRALQALVTRVGVRRVLSDGGSGPAGVRPRVTGVFSRPG